MRKEGHLRDLLLHKGSRCLRISKFRNTSLEATVDTFVSAVTSHHSSSNQRTTTRARPRRMTKLLSLAAKLRDMACPLPIPESVAPNEHIFCILQCGKCALQLLKC